MKKRICLLHTGGTIGMVASENGCLPKAGYLESLLTGSRNLESPEMPQYTFIELSPLPDLSDMDTSTL